MQTTWRQAGTIDSPAERRFGGAALVERGLRNVVPMAAVVILALLVAGVAIASRWPLVHDAPLMHYVVFAMSHGRAPYRDIIEMNMPGTYVIEGLAMRVFGGDAFGWWLWDVLLGSTAVLSCAWIAGKGRRSAGIAGGSLGYLFHLADGPLNLGQRDWAVAVLLLVAFGCMFTSMRNKQPMWMAGFMCFCGLAASIKPPVLGIGVAFSVATCWLVRRRWSRSEQPWARYALWTMAGLSVPFVMDAVFLLRWGVTNSFLITLHGLVAYYAGLHRLSVVQLVEGMLRFRLVLVIALAFVVFFLGRSWRRWESSFLLSGAVAGAGLFLIQGKGWNYHLYPEVAFGALWALLELQDALGRTRIERWIAAGTVCLAAFVLAPRMLRTEHAQTYPMDTLTSLQQDLTTLGGPRLSGKVQCLDMTLGSCINVLYRMNLMQSTGSIYDFYLFPITSNSVTDNLQGRFFGEVLAHPPEIFVLSSQTWPGDEESYAQLDHWPRFRSYLDANYSVIRTFPVQPKTAGYRIYKINAAY